MKDINILLIFLFLMSCQHPKDKYLDEFGLFINDTEANYDNYTDIEFKNVEIYYLELIEQEEDLKDLFSESELKRIKEYHKRYKKARIKRDPLNNLLEIFN